MLDLFQPGKTAIHFKEKHPAYTTKGRIVVLPIFEAVYNIAEVGVRNSLTEGEDELEGINSLRACLNGESRIARKYGFKPHYENTSLFSIYPFFKLVTEIYYPRMPNLVPYSVEDVLDTFADTMYTLQQKTATKLRRAEKQTRKSSAIPVVMLMQRTT